MSRQRQGSTAQRSVLASMNSSWLCVRLPHSTIFAEGASSGRQVWLSNQRSQAGEKNGAVTRDWATVAQGDNPCEQLEAAARGSQPHCNY